MKSDAHVPRLEPGKSLGRYLVLSAVGEGASGRVYAAYDTVLDRKVALKILRPEKAGRGDGPARLLREAQAMARLSHPNVVAVHDAGEIGGEVYVAMEFVAGRTLRERLSGGPRPWREVLGLFLQAGRGLAAAHAAGVVHRDFKPENVLVDPDDRVRVTDFGLASARAGEEGGAGRPDPAASLTATGALLGTPAYMAPEQITGRPSDHRTDQFAFCVALYEALHGERPFAGETFDALAFAVTTGRVREPPRDGRVPAWLRQAVKGGLAPGPDERHPSMEALLSELAREPGRVRRRWLVAGGLALALAVAAAAPVLWRERAAAPCRGGEARLAGAWDATRRAEVESALLGAGEGAAAVSSALQALDGQAASWVAMYRDACEATRVRGAQSEALLDLRMRCLDRRRGELGAVAALLSQGGADVAPQALRAAQSLRSLEVCADADALAAVVEPPDPALAPAIEAVQRRLDEASALEGAGAYARGLGVAAAAVGEARATGYRPLLARALHLEGDLRGRAGDSARAEALLFEALAAAEAGRDDDARAQVLVELVWYEGARLGRHDQAERLGALAEGVLGRLGRPRDDLRGRLESYLGVSLRARGRLEEALERQTRALSLLERALPAGHQAIAGALNNVGLVLWDLGRLAEALEHQRRALALREAGLGPDHPDVAGSWNNVAIVLQDMGRLGEALDAYRRALAIKEASVGPAHPASASTLMNVAGVLHLLGRSEEALPFARRALEIRERVGLEHVHTVVALDVLGTAQRGVGDLAAARRAHRRALELGRRVLGPDHPEVAEALAGLAACDRAAERHAAALAGYREAMAVRERTLGADHPKLASDLVGQGRALLALGRPREARTPLERAARLLERAEVDPGARGEALLELARASLAAGEGARGRALAAEARDLLSRAEGRGRDELALAERLASR